MSWRNDAAARYTGGALRVRSRSTPSVIDGGRSTWAIYTIEHANRDGLAQHLKAFNIPTAAYYPMPMHTQDVYAAYPRPGGLPVSEAKADLVLSLPMYADLDADTQDRGHRSGAELQRLGLPRPPPPSLPRSEPRR